MRRPPLHSWQRLLLAALSGVLFTLLYAPFEHAWLAWITLTPLVLALDGVSLRLGALLGWVTGSVGAAGITAHWIFCAARDYFDLPPLSAAGFALGATQVLGAIHVAVFGLAVALLPAWRWRAVAIAALYVATEFGRAHLPWGGPWTFLGSSQTNLTLIQFCDLTGLPGLTFACALVGAGLAELHRSRLPLVLGLVLTAGIAAYGQWQLGQAATAPSRSLQVELVQGNLPNHQRGRPDFFARHLDHYLELTRSAESPAPALIVWPENAVGFFPEDNPALVGSITDLLHGSSTALLAGAPRAVGTAGVAALYNSAFLFDRNGIEAHYDKRTLLPFVERMPLRETDGPYMPGGAPTLFAIDDTRFGVLICYEAIYPELARELTQRGAELLVNISNDSWFDAGAGPAQHYALTRFRSIENRVSLVRVANSGVSGVTDPWGRELVQLPERTAAARSVAVPIHAGGSFYARHGEWFAMLCIAASIVTVAAAALSGGRMKAPRR